MKAAKSSRTEKWLIEDLSSLREGECLVVQYLGVLKVNLWDYKGNV